MTSLPVRLAVLALVVALCALRCNCGCMSDALGSVLGHAAAPAHVCCHECDEPSPGQPAQSPGQSHDSGCCADDRVPSPATPEIPAVHAAPLPIEFARPTDLCPVAGRRPDPRGNVAFAGERSLLRLHCALTI